MSSGDPFPYRFMKMVLLPVLISAVSSHPNRPLRLGWRVERQHVAVEVPMIRRRRMLR